MKMDCTATITDQYYLVHLLSHTGENQILLAHMRASANQGRTTTGSQTRIPSKFPSVLWDIEEGPSSPGAGSQNEVHGIKLGWIQGVLIPCLLNIWGVMLFLRLSWVVGQAGIGESLFIIAISAVVCVLTTLSLSAISTNGEVKGGGIYYIISRSLGPEFGASIGIVFAFANAVAASMNTIGFCDSLNDLLNSFGLKIIDGGVNDVRIVGIMALAVMIIICAVGMEWESKAQNVLVVIIVGAIIDFIAGACVGPNDDEAKAKGFAGFGTSVLATNWKPQYTFSEGKQQDFFSVFAIFFPSVTGIQAGANISGDLKDPAGAIPKGTLLSLVISMASYAIFVVFAGGAALRDASGNVSELINNTYIECRENGGTCGYGLNNSYSVMQLMSLWGPFIYAGCFAATLSTALTNLLSVPRLIQALGIDKIYPGLIFFSKGYGKFGEPYRGYVLTFVVSSAFVIIANLNTIAPLISNFYLASYALINFCTFHAALIKPLGWRPTFKYYNTWLSLVGFILCVSIMFMIDWVTSLITFIIIFALYLLVVYRKPDVNWGSSTQAQTYKTALMTAHRLNHINEHVKNYRPQILVLSGRPYLRPALVDLANLITKSQALMVCGDISEKRLSHRSRGSRLRKSISWLENHKIRSFFNIMDGLDFENGARALIQASGIGKLKPNVVMIGFKNDWQTCNTDDLLAYFNILHNTFDNRMAVAILRLQDGLDYTKSSDETDDGMLSMAPSSADLTSDTPTNLLRADSNFSIMSPSMPRNDSENSLTFKSSTPYFVPDSPASSMKHYSVTLDQRSIVASPKAIFKAKKKAITEQILSKGANGSVVHSSVPESMSLFRVKQKHGTIDVWWLYDDGGEAYFISFITYAAETWTLNVRETRKVEAMGINSVRSMLAVKRRNRIRNEIIRERMGVQGVHEIAEEGRQMVWASLTILLPYIINSRSNWSGCKLRVFALTNRRQELELEERKDISMFGRICLKCFNSSKSSKSLISESLPSNLQQQLQHYANYRVGECMVTDEEYSIQKQKTDRQLRLRELLQQNSKDASLIVMSLPMPRKGSVSAPLYMAWLEVLTRDLPPFVLVRGNQSSVLTFYS
uniref:Bumetanide-sensitive sodium-(Potassium)-chloride cotransporter n=1 Tax=Timema genevievae TaxID=629358 RepID=A0A7R9PKT0_TIMGE|nr:unnamed protein product [Timema genevievae]